MLDICTYIISFILFSDLVPDTCDSCDMHYLDYITFLDLSCDSNLWSRVLVILWLCYTTITCPRHFMFIIYNVTPCMHGPLVHDLLSQFFLLLLSLSILDNTNHIILHISMPYLYCYCIFIFSLLLFFSLRVLLLVRF